MGAATSEVGYTAAMPRREDHEVQKYMWWHLIKNNNKIKKIKIKIKKINTYTRTYVHACIHTYVNTYYVCTYIRTYIHTYVHTNTHTHKFPKIEIEHQEREKHGKVQ